MTTQRVKGWLADTDVPGIFISDNGGPPSDPRARLEGTGLDVWEVINLCRSAEWEKEAVFRSWPYLPRETLEAAFRYYARNADEINLRLAEEDALGPAWESRRIYRPIDPLDLVERK